MSKFSAPFFAVPPGEIYPKEYAIGEDCPAELEESAASVGALDPAPAAKGKGK